VQTIRGVLGGAGFLVVRHAEVGDAPESWTAVQRSWRGEVVDGGEGGVVLPVACSASQIGSG